jgi:hypothetical protein
MWIGGRTMTTTYNATIEGFRPLVMHNGRLADPLNEHTKALKAIAHKRNKTDDDVIELARIEFIGGLYYDEKEGPVLPVDNLSACLLEGAKMRKNGPVFSTCVEVLPGTLGSGDTFGYKLQYKGPRDTESLWASEHHRLTKGVRVGQSKVMRTRPKFDKWACSFQIEVLDDGPTKEVIEEALNDAGRAKGIGDWTPRYGRFTVKQLEVV